MDKQYRQYYAAAAVMFLDTSSYFLILLFQLLFNFNQAVPLKVFMAKTASDKRYNELFAKKITYLRNKFNLTRSQFAALMG